VYTQIESSFTYEWAKAHFFIGLRSKMNRAAQEQLRQTVEPLIAQGGLELVDLQLLGGGKHRVLRLLIDKEGGVTHEDCAAVSEQLSTILDEKDLIPGGAYTLEVSSPGVDRPLLRERDYRRFVGQKVKIELRAPREGSRRYTGRLLGVSEGEIRLEVGAGKELKEFVVPLADVQKANLKYEW
jgi:ribosome maturation factor RimP